MGLLELVFAILEPFLDGLFEYLIMALGDVLSRAMGEVFTGPEAQNAALATVGYLL